MKKCKYVVVDYYDRPVSGDIIAECDTLKGARIAAYNYTYKECDGEADCALYRQYENTDGEIIREPVKWDW